MILMMIFILFSLSYPNLTVIRQFLPKCRLHPLLTFVPTKLHIFHSLYTHILLYLYLCSELLYLADSLSNIVVPVEHLFITQSSQLLQLLIYQPFHHPHSH